MSYFEEIARAHNKLHGEVNIRLNSIACYKDNIICRIIAKEQFKGVNIFYGIDENQTIYFGPQEEWTSTLYSYDLLKEFALNKKSIPYNKYSVQARLQKFFEGNRDDISGVIE